MTVWEQEGRRAGIGKSSWRRSRGNKASEASSGDSVSDAVSKDLEIAI